jgi:hypothetical protein
VAHVPFGTLGALDERAELFDGARTVSDDQFIAGGAQVKEGKMQCVLLLAGGRSDRAH